MQGAVWLALHIETLVHLISKAAHKPGDGPGPFAGVGGMDVTFDGVEQRGELVHDSVWVAGRGAAGKDNAAGVAVEEFRLDRGVLVAADAERADKRVHEETELVERKDTKRRERRRGHIHISFLGVSFLCKVVQVRHGYRAKAGRDMGRHVVAAAELVPDDEIWRNEAAHIRVAKRHGHHGQGGQNHGRRWDGEAQGKEVEKLGRRVWVEVEVGALSHAEQERQFLALERLVRRVGRGQVAQELARKRAPRKLQAAAQKLCFACERLERPHIEAERKPLAAAAAERPVDAGQRGPQENRHVVLHLEPHQKLVGPDAHAHNGRAAGRAAVLHQVDRVVFVVVVGVLVRVGLRGDVLVGHLKQGGVEGQVHVGKLLEGGQVARRHQKQALGVAAAHGDVQVGDNVGEKVGAGARRLGCVGKARGQVERARARARVKPPGRAWVGACGRPVQVVVVFARGGNCAVRRSALHGKKGNGEGDRRKRNRNRLRRGREL